MRSEYTDTWLEDGQEKIGDQKVVDLPFTDASARALIIRKRDGALLGTLHQKGSRYALPGGAFEDGESSAEAILRELAEEHIELLGVDDKWRSRIEVDYFDGYRELSVWHIFEVDDARIGVSDENVESRWVLQDEDVWHPFMRERILLILHRHLPALTKLKLKLE
jgi:8-oxo-dGTP pyrophosphatase MutT (NUDIX family)